MIRVLDEIPEAIRKFWDHPRPFQKTLVTPRDRLGLFLSTVTDALPIDGGSLSTDQVVFEPDNTQELLNGRGIFLKDIWSFSLGARGSEDSRRVLEAVLSDWIDMLFVPEPALFAMYVDHDEYLTLYARSEEELGRVTTQLESAGFHFVEYMRPPERPPHS